MLNCQSTDAAERATECMHVDAFALCAKRCCDKLSHRRLQLVQDTMRVCLLSVDGQPGERMRLSWTKVQLCQCAQWSPFAKQRPSVALWPLPCVCCSKSARACLTCQTGLPYCSCREVLQFRSSLSAACSWYGQRERLAAFTCSRPTRTPCLRQDASQMPSPPLLQPEHSGDLARFAAKPELCYN